MPVEGVAVWSVLVYVSQELANIRPTDLAHRRRHLRAHNGLYVLCFEKDHETFPF